jgi:hypothetical protein
MLAGMLANLDAEDEQLRQLHERSKASAVVKFADVKGSGVDIRSQWKGL